MSKETRSALVVICVVVGIIVGAARQGSSDSAAAGEGSRPGAESAVAKQVERPGPVPSVDSGGSAPVAAVDSLGTRNLTGREGRTVALTFDDGPHPDHTPRILEILREHDVVATFCVLGSNVARHPELVRDIAADGHALCDHTVSHDMKLPGRDEPQIDKEIGGALVSIRAAVPDAEVNFYRAPGGNFASNVNAVAESYGQTPLGWSVDPRDWGEPGVRRIHDDVVTSVHPGAIVLLHDGGGDRSETVAAVPRIIDTLRDAGYEFVVPVT